MLSWLMGRTISRTDSHPTIPDESRSLVPVDTRTCKVVNINRHECASLVAIRLDEFDPETIARGYHGSAGTLAQIRESPTLWIILGTFDESSAERSFDEATAAIRAREAWMVPVVWCTQGLAIAGRVDQWGTYRSAYSLNWEYCLMRRNEHFAEVPRYTVRIPRNQCTPSNSYKLLFFPQLATFLFDRTKLDLPAELASRFKGPNVTISITSSPDEDLLLDQATVDRMIEVKVIFLHNWLLVDDFTKVPCMPWQSAVTFAHRVRVALE